MKEQQTVEGAFAQLEAVIERLESEEISLEDAFRAYSEGMELLQFCNASIDMVEKKVLKINENGELNEF
ncbi:MAG: exodeoxyribonuclease VII small subunit [Lachnospiraceae bacterium]|nr:exodeoxyribonuclease VII small subunit [Lachnospiraceae bacterium]